VFTITPITQKQIDDLSSKLSSPGNNVGINKTAPNDYIITGHGVTAEATYNGTDTLTVNVKHKPFLIPESMIENGIKEALAKETATS
jgi:hypothetical protein